MRAAELHRLLENLVRLGTVAEVDHARARVRVRSGGLLTAWLPWHTPRAGATRVWDPPTVGEQVVLLSPGGDPAAGVVLTGLYSSANPAPADDPTLFRRVFPDGTRIDYDHAAHRLTADVKGSAELTTATTLTAAVGTDATVTAGGKVSVSAGSAATVEAPAITLNGPTTINGPLAINGPITAGPGAGGAGGATFEGDLQVTGGDVTAEGVSLRNHIHTGDDGGDTGGPR